MLLSGKISVQAPIQKVWDMFLEPETLQACLPGIEKIERLDEKHYVIWIRQKIGPLPLRFNIKATLTRIEAPTLLELEVQREDAGRAGEAGHKARIVLQETRGNSVEISYTVDANIGGTLLAFGDRIMQAKIKEGEAEFAYALQKRLDSRA